MGVSPFHKHLWENNAMKKHDLNFLTIFELFFFFCSISAKTEETVYSIVLTLKPNVKQLINAWILWCVGELSIYLFWLQSLCSQSFLVSNSFLLHNSSSMCFLSFWFSVSETTTNLFLLAKMLHSQNYNSFFKF